MRILSIDNGQLVLRDGFTTLAEGIESVEVLLAKQPSVMCSSSIDFPEEATDNPEIIAWCHALRAQGNDAHRTKDQAP